MTQTTDANVFLMGGPGAKAWKFEDPNTTRTGTIKAPPIARQERDYDPNNPGGGAPKTFPSGDPIMGIVVEVQTDERDPSDHEDTGTRTFYIEGLRGGLRRLAGQPGRHPPGLTPTRPLRRRAGTRPPGPARRRSTPRTAGEDMDSTPKAGAR
ncbi:hypothetical protein [Janibacter melonis]|uniref:hypothetical protein n=1 Tax=Janibacter melonis TaxID=262209 RepID=UPI001748A3FE|nr:hypothetical protein [Janibacter melonis]